MESTYAELYIGGRITRQMHQDIKQQMEFIKLDQIEVTLEVTDTSLGVMASCTSNGKFTDLEALLVEFDISFNRYTGRIHESDPEIRMFRSPEDGDCDRTVQSDEIQLPVIHTETIAKIMAKHGPSIVCLEAIKQAAGLDIPPLPALVVVDSL